MDSDSLTRSPAAQLLSVVGETLGLPAQHILGLPASIALRVEDRGDGRYFLSGLASDVLERACAMFDVTIVKSGSEATAQVADGAVVVDEWWPEGALPLVGFGPALLAVTVADGDAARCVCFAVDEMRPMTGVERVEALRGSLGQLAARLDLDAVNWNTVAEIAAALSAQPALENVAESRALFGHFLVEAADWMDDERIDQLGDGYLRASRAWSRLAATGSDVEVVAEIEQQCAHRAESLGEKPRRFML